MPLTIFFCYAREDEMLLNKLKTHLRPLQREGLIDVWYDRDISAGTEWEQEVKMHLNSARIILLLLSPDFMNSDYCYSIEMRQALERHEVGKAKVIPIILRPVYWHIEPLSKLQVLPTDGTPITSASWHDQDEALYDVTQGIHKVVAQLTDPHASASYIVSEATQPRVQQENQQQQQQTRQERSTQPLAITSASSLADGAVKLSTPSPDSPYSEKEQAKKSHDFRSMSPPAQVSQKMEICPGCGASNQKGEPFCNNCDVALVVALPAQVSQKMEICPGCGASNQKGEPFCNNCDVALRDLH